MAPHTLQDIRNKVRRITGRPSQAQLTDADLDNYINTFYLYDFPEHLRLESLRFNYQFVTQANIPVYDFDTSMFLTNMPPVYIAGYQSYMTQSRDNFFRVNPQLQFLQQTVYSGTGIAGDSTLPQYQGQFLTNTPILTGFQPNPPGAYNTTLTTPTKSINWNVLVTGQGAPLASGITPWYTLVDDGIGNLVSLDDPNNTSGGTYSPQGSINYLTGAIDINCFVVLNTSTNTLEPVVIPAGNPVNVQYIPYVASRPQSVAFYQDQFYVYPIPDQPYTVSFEAYKYPTQLLMSTDSPQLNEWWQTLAYGASDKIFADNADMENMAKFRPLLDEQMRLVLRRTIVQQTSERTATIYTEQSGMFGQYPFGNLFSGF